MRPHGGGSTRPQRDDPRRPNLGMPDRRITDPGQGGNDFTTKPGPGLRPGGGRPIMNPPDLTPGARGLGYGGQYNPKSANFGVPQRDYFAEFNAWQDPNISDGGASAGQLQRGYGGFEALNGAGGMLGTKLNGFLNQFNTGGDREKAMNALGYFNGGNPYTPRQTRSEAQFYRQNARSNAQTGDMSYAGTYQHQSPGAYAAGPGEQPSMNFGGYTGFTDVAADGSASYRSLDPRRQGRTRPTRSFGQVAY